MPCPRYVTRGLKVGVRFKERAGYDYHAGTFREDLGPIIRQLHEVLPVADVVSGHGWQGYSSSLRLKDELGFQVAFIAYGGANPGVHVQVSGDSAEDWVAHLQGAYPSIHTTRIDAAIDWASEGLFDQIVTPTVDRFRDSRKILSAGDWHSSETSRTIYFGSPSSRVRVRLYEKGAEVLEKFGSKIPGLESAIPPGWVRLEVQIRPDHQDVVAVAHRVPAVELFGASKVSRSIIQQIDGVALPKLRVQKVRVPLAVEQGYQQAIAQYGPTLARFRAHCGDDDFIARLFRDLDQIAAQKGI